MKNGFQKAMLAGAIAGLVDGLASFCSSYVGSEILGLWHVPPEFWTFPFALFALVSGFLPYNIMWGVVFGLAFAMVYDRIPKKGPMKGLIFALIFYWVLSNLRNSQIMWSFGEVWWPTVQVWVGFFASVAYGLTLGYLYKKE